MISRKSFRAARAVFVVHVYEFLRKKRYLKKSSALRALSLFSIVFSVVKEIIAYIRYLEKFSALRAPSLFSIFSSIVK